MPKKCIALLLSFVVFYSFALPSSAFENHLNSYLCRNTSVTVVEKNLETNLVEEKTYSCDTSGFSEIEIINQWIDDTGDNLAQMSDMTFSNSTKVELRSIIGTDGRTVVSNTRIFPYSATEL